ncbi:MAG TPA: phosphatidylglycerophosphatase A [Thermoplasmata archaeon]|nr:phosphatidylglycerophosphatase A [Thermoplasmata archaeon]
MKAIDILGRSGVTIDSLEEAGFELYVQGDGETDVDLLKQAFRRQVERYLEDPNVSLLISAAAYLDGVLESEWKGDSRVTGDAASLVADELIGMSIAEYIAGKRGLFNYVRYDRAKPGILARLPPFMDDAVGALVAACMTRAFER